MIESNSYSILQPRPQAPLRVLCFHYAGGSEMSFASWLRQMPPEAELCLFELPGRGRQAGDPFPANFTQAVDFFLQGVVEAIDRPVLLLGHSLGGLLAYTLACALPEEKKRLVQRVIVSAASSPKTVAEHAKHPAAAFLVRSRASVLDDLLKLGGIPKELLDEPVLLEQAVNTLGHDFHLLDTYVADRCDGRGLATEIWLGRNDPAVSMSEADLWRESAATPVQVRLFEGDHFYLFKNPEPIALLRNIIQQESNAQKETHTNGSVHRQFGRL